MIAASDAYYEMLQVRATERSTRKTRAAERQWQAALDDRNVKLRAFYGEGPVFELLRLYYDDTVLTVKRPRRRPSAS